MFINNNTQTFIIQAMLIVDFYKLLKHPSPQLAEYQIPAIANQSPKNRMKEKHF